MKATTHAAIRCQQRGIPPLVIPPFLRSGKSRGYAAKANFCFGVMPPRPMWGRS